MEITGAEDVAPSTSENVGETQFLRFSSGETFEEYGARYLGSALRGELIRRINPELAGLPEQAGDRVRVFEKSHDDMRGRVTPQAIPFNDDAGLGAVPALLEELAIERLTNGMGLDYDQLPEVLAGLV